MNGTHSILDILDPDAYGLRITHRLDESIVRRYALKPSRRLVIAMAVSITAILFMGLFVYQTHAEFSATGSSVGAAVDPSSGKVYLSAQAAAAAASLSNAKQVPMLEMHIANNGLVLLHGARVVSISGDDIRMEIEWNSAHFTWVANTNSNTKFVASNGEKTTLTNIKVGETLTVSGMLNSGGTEPTIDAQFVRE